MILYLSIKPKLVTKFLSYLNCSNMFKKNLIILDAILKYSNAKSYYNRKTVQVLFSYCKSYYL